jgi:anti-sigma-K factor RskA
MIIDERLEELASLYVLGALEGAELREFEETLRTHPKMQEFVAKLGKSVTAVAGTVPVAAPPPELRTNLLAQIAPQKIVTLPPARDSVFGWLRLLATGLAVLCLVLAGWNWDLIQTIHRQTRQLGDSQQLNQALQEAKTELAALQESNRLADLRITMLNSLVADAPKTVAVTLWDKQAHKGVFVVQNLKTLPPDQDYELWVMDEHKIPVAAGVFHIDDSGTIHLNFKPSRPLQTAGQFCVTAEIKGGVDSPTLKNLVLASN